MTPPAERMSVRLNAVVVTEELAGPGAISLTKKVPADVPSLDFSGFTVYTHANVADTIVTSICAALEARKEVIAWQEPGPLPLDRMCRDTADGPLDIPLHPAAERFWRERGYLS